MERETELTQSWNPELAALNDKPGGLLNGIPLLVGGELRTFSLPVPLDDDGTDISLKDWQLGPRSSTKDPSTPPYSIKPFRGSVRTRFTPIDEDLSSPRGSASSARGQSSPDHFETGPTTPRTPRASSSGSASPASSFLQEGDHTLMATLHNDSSESNSSLKSSAADAAEPPHHPTGGIAFDITPDPANKSTRSLRVSFAEQQRPSAAPVVRHRSPLKSRSLHPPKEVKALQPKWESSTKIRHPITPTTTTTPKPHLHAPPHGMRRKTSSTPGAKQARVQAVAPMPTHEIEVVDGDSGYLSDGTILKLNRLMLRSSLDHSQSIQYSDHSSNRLSHVSRDLTMSPNRAFSDLPRSLSRKHGTQYQSEEDDDDEEDTKMGVLCGGGLTDTKLISGDFMRLLSKLCRVPVPKQQAAPSAAMTRGRSKPQLERSKTTTSLSWDARTTTKESSSSVMGRRHSLQLLSEKCSNAPAPKYDARHKPRKIRTHEPHVHFYRTISKTLDQKLKS